MALDVVGEVLVRVIVEVIGYGTGRVVIPLLSLGKARVDEWSARRYLTTFKLWWREDRQVVFSGGTAAFLGVVFWIAVAIAAYMVQRSIT